MVARRVFVAMSFFLLLTLLAEASWEMPSLRPRYKSPLGLAVDATGRFAYVALHTANALAVVDLHDSEVLCEIPVGRKPYDVALYKGIAYVTCEADDTLVAVDVAKRMVKKIHKVGQAPRGVSVDPRTGWIQVVCHDDKMLWMLDGTRIKKEPIPPQPEGNFARTSNLELMAGSPWGYRPSARPFNLFTGGQSIADPKHIAFQQPQPQRTAFNPTLELDYTRTSMDLVAHTRPRWFTPTASAPEGRIFTNAFSFFLNSASSAAIVLLDEPDKGYPDPTDVVVKLPKSRTALAALTPTTTAATHPLKGAKVFISSGGADSIVVLDLEKAAKHFESSQSFNPQIGGFGMSGGWGGGMPGGHMMNHGWGMPGMGMSGMQFGGMGMGTHGSMRTVANPGPGMPNPAAIASPPRTLNPGSGGMPAPNGVPFAGPFPMGMGWQGGMQGMGFAGFREDLRASAAYTIARLPTEANPRRMVLSADGKTLIVSNHLADSLTVIDADKLRVVRHIDLGGPEPDLARRGEILFHSAKLTFQQQFTCASCHPNLGSDGLSWNTDPKGTGEPLNTRALHGVRDTGPFGWKGESETFEERARNTMHEVHKHQISDDDASAIAAFMKTIDPPRPLPRRAKDRPIIARGEALFFGKANCIRCHRGAAYTSPYPRAVILDQKQQWTPFDVPSLRGVARTAPYLHDGRAATLEEIFEHHNPQKRHGLAHELTRPEMSDLIAFLKSL